MFFIRFVLTFVIVFCAFQANASDAVDKFWEKAVASSTPSSTQFSSLRTEEVAVQDSGPKYVLYFEYTSSGNTCSPSNFRSLDLVRLGRCIRDGNASKKLTVALKNGVVSPDVFLTLKNYKDTSCKKIKSSDTIKLPPLNSCREGAKFQLSDSFPDEPPAGVSGAVFTYYNTKSECQSNENIGNPYFVQIFARNRCIDGDSPDSDLKVTSCSNSKGISYHTYPSTKGTCSGKLAKKTFNKKCQNKDPWGQTTNGYVDFFCM